uniref:Uncharacterized protein n=1 Tax=Caenorhabditis japonica TaxID=281687 RepID=A0A8R1EC56_CAEJA
NAQKAKLGSSPSLHGGGGTTSSSGSTNGTAP